MIYYVNSMTVINTKNITTLEYDVIDLPDEYEKFKGIFKKTEYYLIVNGIKIYMWQAARFVTKKKEEKEYTEYRNKKVEKLKDVFEELIKAMENEQ